MLEPDSGSSSPSRASPPKSSSPFLKSAKRPTSGASREKAAFLFGEDDEESNKSSPRLPPVSDAEEGFNMGTIKGKQKP
jgi:TBC1 domain family member 5